MFVCSMVCLCVCDDRVAFGEWKDNVVGTLDAEIRNARCSQSYIGFVHTDSALHCCRQQ